VPNDELIEVVGVAHSTYSLYSTDFIFCLKQNAICLVFCY